MPRPSYKLKTRLLRLRTTASHWHRHAVGQGNNQMSNQHAPWRQSLTWLWGTRTRRSQHGRGWRGACGATHASHGTAPGWTRVRCCRPGCLAAGCWRRTGGRSHGRQQRGPRTWCPVQASTVATQTCRQIDHVREPRHSDGSTCSQVMAHGHTSCLLQRPPQPGQGRLPHP